MAGESASQVECVSAVRVTQGEHEPEREQPDPDIEREPVDVEAERHTEREAGSPHDALREPRLGVFEGAVVGVQRQQIEDLKEAVHSRQACRGNHDRRGRDQYGRQRGRPGSDPALPDQVGEQNDQRTQ